MNATDQLAVALDVSNSDDAEQLADSLRAVAGVFKVGLELFTSAGPEVVGRIAQRGRVFLDLKLHAIPNTVEHAARAAARVGASYLTVHASGGREMVKAAVRGAAPQVQVLAVTLLTSLSAADLGELGFGGSMSEAVLRLAQLAVGSGAAGVVCSPAEVSGLRAALGPDPLLVVPGIRPTGAAVGDQKRVGTPGDAIRAGASLLVVGRPIREASSPRLAAEAILREIAEAQAVRV